MLQTNLGHNAKNMGPLHCIITYFLCFKVIRYILQLPWVDLNSLIAHFLCFKTIRYKENAAGISRTALLHIFCVLTGTQSSAYGSLLTALIHKLSVLKRLSTNTRERGSIYTASSHICCVLRRLRISLIQRGTFS